MNCPNCERGHQIKPYWTDTAPGYYGTKHYRCPCCGFYWSSAETEQELAQRITGIATGFASETSSGDGHESEGKE